MVIVSGGAGGAENVYADRLIYSLLKDNSTTEMAVDGTTPVKYKYTATAPLVLTRAIFDMVDANIRPNKLGGINAVTNGLKVELYDADDTLLIDFLDGTTIKQNSDFSHLASIDVLILDAAGLDHLPIRWTIAKTGRGLRMKTGQYLQVTVRDNLAAIDSFTTVVQGYLL